MVSKSLIPLLLIFLPLATLKLGRFHRTFLDEFTIIVNNYMDALESQLKNDLANSFTLEKWLPAR